MKVFFDTNVVVSALTTRGLCAGLMERLIESQEQLLIGEPVVAELTRILAEKFGVILGNSVPLKKLLS
jgi:predicted nucleic acid-binding protein